MQSILPILAVFLPFAFAIVIAIFGERFPRLRSALVLISSIITFAVIAQMVKPVIGEGVAFSARIDIIIGLHFKTHPLGMTISALASFMWIFTMIYSFGYMAHEHAQARYYAALNIALGATMAILNAGDLFTFFVFYEIFTLSVYPLVVHEETPEAMEGGKVYLIYLVTGEALVLLSVFLVYGITVITGGSAALTTGILAGCGVSKGILYAIAILFLVGFSVKAAIMPLHTWLPHAMVAPTPISAVLHAVAVVNVGVFAVMTLIYIILGTTLSKSLNLHSVLPWVVSVTILFASIIAIVQDDIKRRLAYSTVSQLSYMILGAALLNPFALRGGVLHVLLHSFMKIVLFFCAGIIITQTGKKKFSQIAGQARQMPITWACFTVGAIGMIGLPPVCGWVSKWALIQGCLEAERPIFAVVLLISGLLNMIYFLPPVFSAWFGEKDKNEEVYEEPVIKKKREAPLSMLVPVSILAIFCVVLGLNTALPYWFAENVTKAIF